MFKTRQAVPFAKGNTAQKGKKRGPKYFRYTFQQVADASGLKVGTLHNKKHAQKLRQVAETGDLKQLILFLYELTWHSRVSRVELRERYGADASRMWAKRYPRFGLYWCPDCTAWVLAAARCLKHGGSPVLLMDRSTGDVLMRVETKTGEVVYESYARLVAGATGLETVKHLDGNRWNNRASNLQVCKAAPPDHVDATPGETDE